MAFRQRLPSFRPQLSVRRVYETLQPQSETQELPEAYVLRVYIPGFPRGSVKITYEAISRTVRITGERHLQGTRWHKIDQSYPIPDYCEAEALQGKFETPVLTLTMPKKKAISEVAPKQQEVEAPQGKGVVAEPKPDENVQETTPPPQPKTTTKVEESTEDQKNVSPKSPDLREPEKDTLEKTQSQTDSEAFKDQKGQGGGVEKVGPSEPQLGEKELEPKPAPPTKAATMQTNERPLKSQEEVESKPTPTRVTTMQTDEKPPKGQEEFEEKSTPKMEPKTKTDEQPPKGQEEVEPEPAITTVTRKTTIKEQIEEKKREESIAEDVEKERISNKEVKEETSESRNPVNDKEDGDFEEKETKAEKLLAKEAEPSAPKKKKEKTKGNTGENAVERGASVSEVFTKISEGMLNQEERKLAANIAAAVLVIAALGYYVSNKLGRT